MMTVPEKVRIEEIRFYMRNVRTRMPFRYGSATLTSVPILHASMELEAGGAGARGVAADILPPRWFDKDPARSYQENVDDLLFAARAAARAYREAGQKARSAFELWREGCAAALEAGAGRGLNSLTAMHGSTLMERALIDALGKGSGKSYWELLKTNALGIDLGVLNTGLKDLNPAAVIAPAPRKVLHIRHTVGLGDPIWKAEIAPQERLEDGLPQALEEYLELQGLSYFKLKLRGELEEDLERLRRIAALLDRPGREYWISLDGNEQYGDPEEVLELLDRIENEGKLGSLYRSILYIEQPLERQRALDAALEAGIRSLAARKPLLIDESDGELDSFARAAALGYVGVSAKNCKGLLKALANQALAGKWKAERGAAYFLSGEDLMNLPVVPLHQDLAHLAALGIAHAERNGHHYVRGLDHLSAKERRVCRQRHRTLYREEGEMLSLDIREGRIDISSLQAPGLGVGDAVELESMVPLEEWDFASLA